MAPDPRKCASGPLRNFSRPLLDRISGCRVTSIAGIAIKQDAEGRYCLNDFHKAAGGAERDNPNRWVRTYSHRALAQELTPILALAPVSSRHGGKNPGTFVVKELVYAYAMWISAKFHLTVIRAYDGLVQKQVARILPMVPATMVEALR